MITLKKKTILHPILYILKKATYIVFYDLFYSRARKNEEKRNSCGITPSWRHIIYLLKPFNIKINLFSLEKELISHGLIFLFRFNHLAQGWRIFNEKINTMNSKWRSSYLLLEITIGNYSIYLSNECYIFPGIKRTRLCKLQSKGN